MITANPVEALLQLSAGHYVSRALHAVAELGVADALGDAPQPTAALADRTAAHAGALDRVLRLLAQHGVFEYHAGVIGHTPSSRMLRQDHPQSMRSLVRMFGLPGLWTTVGELPSAIRRENRVRIARCPVASGGISERTRTRAEFLARR